MIDVLIKERKDTIIESGISMSRAQMIMILITGPPVIIVVQERVALVCDIEYRSTGYNSGPGACCPGM